LQSLIFHEFVLSLVDVILPTI